MKLTFRFSGTCRAGLLVLLLGGLSAGAQEASVVSKIEIQHIGPPTASDSLVRAHIRVKPGEAVTQTGVDDDIRSLYATGYFINVQVDREQRAEGLTLVYRLEDKPLLTSVRFSGNKKYSDKKLLTKVTSKTGEPLDDLKLFADSQAIQKLYQSAGFPGTTVKPVQSIDAPAGKGSVTFEIVEGVRVKIEKVEFDGASAVPEKKLRKVVKTRRRWMFSWITGSGYIKEDVLEDDKDRLFDFYRAAGYIDFDLKEVRRDTTGPKSEVVHFVIGEGRKYQVGSVSIKGNAILPEAQIAAMLRLNTGKVFTPQGLTKDVDAISDLYGAMGYVDVQVLAIKSPNVETGTMDLVYQIEEGEKSYIEKIEIRGNTKTKDKVIRRELTVAPGEVFNMVAVNESQRHLEQLNYFEKVRTQPEPSDVSKNRKNLVVGVDEKSTGNFMVGAGFSSIDSVVGFAEVTEGNFDLFKPPRFEGGGQKARLRISFGASRQDYELSFTEPWFLERRLRLDVDLYHRRLDFVSLNSFYNERRTGIKLGLSRPLYALESLGLTNIIGSVYYNLENVGVINVTTNAPAFIQSEAGSRVVSKLGAALAWDHLQIDPSIGPNYPTNGFYTRLSSEVAGGPLLGDTKYYKFELNHSHYFKGFGDGHVLQFALNAGAANAFGGAADVPFFDRFYLGGLESLRGYEYRGVGPRDGPTGEPMGGDTYWFGSLEYSVPIIPRLRVAAFYDIGMVYHGFLSTHYDRLKGEKLFNDNWGVGLRLNIPQLGPLRLDFGVPMTHSAGNGGSGKFQFGADTSRQF